MKSILLVETSPRRNGNCEIITDMIAGDLKGENVTVFKMREKTCNPCMACGECQGKDTQMCVRKDDITPLLPVIEECDAILVVTPIYNQQITSRAKLFIERFYPFFNAAKKNMSNTHKFGKKAALVCVCWGSPIETVKAYADWTVSGFSQIGAEEFRSCVFNGLAAPGDVKNHPDYLESIHELSKWLA